MSIDIEELIYEPIPERPPEQALSEQALMVLLRTLTRTQSLAVIDCD